MMVLEAFAESNLIPSPVVKNGMREGSVQRRRNRETSESETAEVVECRRCIRPSGSINCFRLSADSPDGIDDVLEVQEWTGVDGESEVRTGISGVEVGRGGEGTAASISDNCWNF